MFKDPAVTKSPLGQWGFIDNKKWSYIGLQSILDFGVFDLGFGPKHSKFTKDANTNAIRL